MVKYVSQINIKLTVKLNREVRVISNLVIE